MNANLVEKYSPRQVAELIQSIDSSFHLPSAEQELIISIKSNPLEPAVVIAGAGSGKTETMAARVVYLVANGFVRPDQILGLTFTRKAAGELNMRIRKRLRQLQQALEKKGLQSTFTSVDTSVTTYHSYAGRLLSDHAIRFGIDADSQPLGEAALWMLANKVVREWDGEDFTHESSVKTVVEDLLGLTSTALEHRATSEQIRAVDESLLEKLSALEGRTSNKEVRGVVRTLQQRIAMLPMMEHFIEVRRQGGELSFDDQISLAADIAENFPDVGQLERGKYPVVLLDEYQDTSQSQVRMLSSLFGGGHPVTAVGDPCQSIYTWRGASSGTISSFNSHFPKGAGATGAKAYQLLTTYRNDQNILDVANAISSSVRALESLDVQPLKARDGAGAGNLVVGAFEDIDTEAQAISDYFKPLWSDPERGAPGSKKAKTFAVLVRRRSQIPAIQRALLKDGIDVEVLGLGGLVHVPEVADIIAMLKILNDPTAGAALMRHLVGPRINLGPRDIAALGSYSKKLASVSAHDSRSLVKSIVEGNAASAEADDQILGSVIDALDEIDKADKTLFSEEGFTRLSNFAHDLRRLRSRASAPLTDLISEIERYLNIEAEVLLRQTGAHGRRHLDRFMDEASKFARSGGSLSSFLDWLDIASDEESGLKAGAPDVDPNVVQILTIHMAKGAEWDVVAVPGLAEGVFPSKTTHSPDNWIANERHIPFELRGDGALLPIFSLNGVTTFAAASKHIEAYKDACYSYREREEIRLGYVAMTRARTHLICTTSYWRDGVKPVKPSSLFNTALEIAKRSGTILTTSEEPADTDRNPQELVDVTAIWPHDRLADSRTEFNQSVIEVERATAADLSKRTGDAEIDSWFEDAQAIMRESEEFLRGVHEVRAPARLSTSSLISLHKDRNELARNIRRPMPRALDEYSSRGTAFHAWIEHHLKGETLFDDDDLDFFEALEADQKLEELKEKWMASEWATLSPHDVEVGFETEIAGVLIRGRIDAIYKTATGFEVVDWKTGSKELDESAAVQLAVYRLAWSRLAKVPIEQVSAAFHYVPTNKTDRRNKVMSEAELIALFEGQR